MADRVDHAMSVLAQTATVRPSVAPTSTFTPPPAGGTETAIAGLSIALALAAGILGWRILRGGRGL